MKGDTLNTQMMRRKKSQKHCSMEIDGGSKAIR